MRKACRGQETKERGRLQAGHGAGMEQQRQLVRHSCGEQSCSYMHPACTECRTAAHLLLCSKGGEVCATECFIFEAVIVSGERETGGGGRRTAQRMKQQQHTQGAPLRRLVAGNQARAHGVCMSKSTATGCVACSGVLLQRSPPSARPPPHLRRPDPKPWLPPRTSDALPLLAGESALKRTPPDMARQGSAFAAAQGLGGCCWFQLIKSMMCRQQ
jgi:hypothetical protein